MKYDINDPKNSVVHEIHPLDFAEMVMAEAETKIGVYEKIGEDTYEFAGRYFHQNAATPRTDGPHTLF